MKLRHNLNIALTENRFYSGKNAFSTLSFSVMCKGLCRSKRSSAFFVRGSGCALFILKGVTRDEKTLYLSFGPLSKYDFTVTARDKNFVVGVDYDDGYVYTTLGPGVSALAAENGDIVVNADTLYGSKILSPLTTMNYTLYLTCPKAVRDQTEKSLMVFFTVGKDESEKYEFKIR